MNENINEVLESMEQTKPTKRPYRRRSKEEIAAEKAAKEARKNAKAAAKAAKEAAETVEEPPAEEKKAKSEKSKKGNGQKPVLPAKLGAWSDPTKSILYNKMYVEVKLLEPALGTSPSDKDLLTNFIASNAPDAPSREEEIAALGESGLFEKGTTIFMKGQFKLSDNGEHFIDILDRKDGGRGKKDYPVSIRMPYLWNYQVRGFFKDSCGLLARGNYGNSAAMSAYRKVIDGGIFVSPRRLAVNLPTEYFDEDGNLVPLDPDKLPILQRPLRTSGPSGERSAIASSEMIPEGSTIKFCINYTEPKWRDVIVEWLNYGAEHGLGAWRNSGRGAFIWRELNEDWSPIVDEDEEE